MNQARTRVLVTGGSGFIGRHLCQQLVQQSYAVNLLSRRPEPGEKSGLHSSESSAYIGDISDPEILNQALEKVEVVYHLAGIAHVDGPDKSALQSVNIDGTANLIKAAQAAGVQKIIYFSSSLAAAAETAAAQATDYGASKYQAEMLLTQAAESGELDVCILRSVNVYGTGMKGNLAAMIRLISKGILPPLPRVEARFSLVEVKDLCQAAIIAAEHDASKGKTYYVTDGVDYNINEIEQAIYKALGKVKPRWHIPRVVLYAAAAGAELFGKLNGRKSGLGTRTYRNLISGNVYSNAPICNELGFKFTTTFYNELPGIVTGFDNYKLERSE